MHRIFSNFAYILLLGMSGMGLLMGKIRPISMELLPFLPLKNGFWPVIKNNLRNKPHLHIKGH